jgi:hypothetical protein
MSLQIFYLAASVPDKSFPTIVESPDIAEAEKLKQRVKRINQ